MLFHFHGLLTTDNCLKIPLIFTWCCELYSNMLSVRFRPTVRSRGAGSRESYEFSPWALKKKTDQLIPEKWTLKLKQKAVRLGDFCFVDYWLKLELCFCVCQPSASWILWVIPGCSKMKICFPVSCLLHCRFWTELRMSKSSYSLKNLTCWELFFLFRLCTLL